MFSSAVTDAERRGWQRSALHALDQLLGLDLPTLTWTVGETATLVGRVLLGDVDTRRARWQAWVTALDATPAPEYTRHGVTELRATARRRDPLVDVVLLATVYDPGPNPELDGR